jgi:hypothetical protein
MLTLDDAKNSNLIFLGSPTENLPLNDLPGLKEFAFESVANGVRKGDVAIRNKHPRTGEQAIYLREPGLPVSDDYFIIALMRGYDANHWILWLSGSGSIGTQAAADYACNPEAVRDLLKALGPSSSEKPFEALLHSMVKHGVPVSSGIVAVRTF